MRRAGRRSGGEDVLRPRLGSPSRLVVCTCSSRVLSAARLRQPLSRTPWLDRLALPSAGCLGGPGRAGPPIVPS
jgi:hypothetical protein